MSTKKMDWKLGGQMFAMLVQFFTNISALFKRCEVEPEILNWINGPGNDYFNRHMREVAQEFKSLLIDCDSDPAALPGMFVKSNRKMGVIVWDPIHTTLVRFVGQDEGSGKAGVSVRGALKEYYGVMNASILFYLLRNPQRTPAPWKGNRVCFWGTVYGDNFEQEYVLSLDLTGQTPKVGKHMADGIFYCINPAACLMKPA